MKRTSYVLAATLLMVGCPGNETADSGIDATAAIDAPVPVSDPITRRDAPIDAVTADSPLPCGELGALCCDGDVCSEGVCATSGPAAGRCELENCGTTGGPCCAVGAECRAGLSCTADVCEDAACGAPGQPCCGGDCDDVGDQYFCLSGSCLDCGELDEACCPGALACLGTLSCVGGTCETPVCGMPGMPCCAGDTCSGTLECVRGEFNICTDTSACGHLGEACCAAGTGCVGSAPPGLECRFGMCGACGAAGQSCCNTGPGVATRCATGLSCSAGSICG